MSAMAPKHADLSAAHNAINPLGALAVIQTLGVPTGGDAYQRLVQQDGKLVPITDPANLAVGDLAFTGQGFGRVKSITDDGEVSPTTIGCVVQWDSTEGFIQNPGQAPDPVRETSYHWVDNSTVDLSSVEIEFPNELKLLSGGVVFLRRV